MSHTVILRPFSRTICTVLTLICALTVSPAHSREFFVSTTGADSNDGTKAAPFQSVQRAVANLKPGDVCTLRGGRYHEVVQIRGVQGTAEEPIVIRSFPGEWAILDGTIPIRSKWSRHNGSIWKTTLDQDIWQLFVDNKNMTLARWPNSRCWTEHFWDQSKSWARSEDVKKGYADGTMVDSDLASLQMSLVGGVVVINSDRWRSRAGTIISHNPGSDRFEFTKVKDFATRGSHYYFVTALALLDAEEEWFYDEANKTLYLYSETDPGLRDVRGRVIDASLVHSLPPKKRSKKQNAATEDGDLPGAEHLVLDRIAFYASRVNLPRVQHLTIQNSHFVYSVASMRTLGSTADGRFNQFEACHHLKLINNTFRFCDGKSLVANHATNPLLENCLFYMIDFACLAGGSNSYTVQMEGGLNPIYRRNEINTAGASEGMRISAPPDAPALTEYNYHTHCGLMQTDGASIQYPPGGNTNSINRFNWFINVNRTGHRFDGDPGGEWGIVYRCVSALGGHRGFRFKGDNHEVYHNIAMDNHRGDDINISKNKGPTRHEGKANLHSRVQNNAAQSSNLQANLIIDPANKTPNWDGPNTNGDLRNELRDPDNLDFRPRKDSALIDAGIIIDHVRLRQKGAEPTGEGIVQELDISATYKGSAPDIGAYEFGDENYWIPGRILPRASRPIPANGSMNAKPDTDLIWLGGKDAIEHRIYVGTSKTNLALKRTQKNNICVPNSGWTPGATYCWRVDTVTAHGTVQGAVWVFTIDKR